MFSDILCFILQLTAFFVIISGVTSNEYCAIKDGNKSCNDHSQTNRYSDGANHQYYLDKIQKAKAAYTPCSYKRCSCFSSVISDDLRVFKNGITKDQIEAVKSKGTKYQIVDHRLYRDRNCMFPARCAGIEHFIQKLLPKLPDMEFIVNTRDWPQVPKNLNMKLGPVFSFSKTDLYHDIMYPAWAFWEGGPAISLYPRGIGRWDQHRKTLGTLGNATSWDEKINKGFFRGSRTSSERDALILLSRERPDLVDAKYTKNQAWKSDADTLHQPPATEVPFEDHCSYKYLFNFRGVAASFRFKHILLCKSLVFHVGSDWLEFFYVALKPWIHYIPLDASADQKKITELLQFVATHDDVAREIAENGYNVIWNHLRLEDVSCYWRKLLKKYAGLLKYDVVLDESLILITG